jgi:hypothetical protein
MKLIIALHELLCYKYSSLTQTCPYYVLKRSNHMIKQQSLLRGFLVTMILNSALHGAGTVSSANSTIDFPHDQAYINTNYLTIIGTLRDNNGTPVTNETVQILINGYSIGTASSDVNGIYRFPVSQGLPDGQYQLSIFCVESQAIIESNQFNIDTTAPSITIMSPQDGQTITTNTVLFSGLTEQNAMVMVFVDSDAFGNICYADGNGNWSIEYELDSGNHTIAVQATDIAGNQGYISDVLTFSVNV